MERPDDGKSYVCIDCGVELNDDNWSPGKKKIRARVCRSCATERGRQWQSENKKRCRENETARARRAGILPVDKNRSCPGFLGIHIAEQVLAKVFPNVVQMPVNNIGYDYICSKNKRIDVKSATASKTGGWGFHIRKNCIADHFLCIAFDNRTDLNPIHLWLIPGKKVNCKNNLSIPLSKIHAWKKYELPIDKVSACCDTMR
jgi:hypothetical protein